MSYRDPSLGQPSSSGDVPARDPHAPTRRVEGTGAMSRPWRGADHAGDFLGLDLEIRAHAHGSEAVSQPIFLDEPAPFYAQQSPALMQPTQPAPQRPAPSPAQQQTYAEPTQQRALPVLQTLEPIPQQASPPSLFDLMQPNEEELALLAKAPSTERSNSWLLGLDDARAGRAGHAPVVDDPTRARHTTIAPQLLETSFHEAPPAVQRTGPWLVRILLGAAAVSIVYVTYQTFDARRRARPVPLQQPLIPVGQTSNAHEDELADPSDFNAGAAREQHEPTPRGAKPGTAANRPNATGNRPKTSTNTNAANGANGARSANSANSANANSADTKARAATTPHAPIAVTNQPRSISITESAPLEVSALETSASRDIQSAQSSLKSSPKSSSNSSAQPTPTVPNAARLDDTHVPQWWSGSLRTAALATNEIGPDHVDYAGSAERQERLQRWLMVQSRSASPRADTSATRPSQDGASDVLTANALPALARDVLQQKAAQITAKSGDSNGNEVATVKPEPKIASISSVSAIWDGNTVPVEQIDSSARISTPQVGQVRIYLARGDSVEGRLQAIGQGQLWIDTNVGRIAFGADQIDRIEQIAMPTVALDTKIADATGVAKPETKSEPKSAATPTNSAESKLDPKAPTKPAPPVTASEPKVSDRVRVTTPGGIFYGRIVERDATSVTLVTDEGAQVTVDSADVEVAPLQKTVVKHESKGSKSSAKKTAPKPAPTPEDESPTADTPKRP